MQTRCKQRQVINYCTITHNIDILNNQFYSAHTTYCISGIDVSGESVQSERKFKTSTSRARIVMLRKYFFYKNETWKQNKNDWQKRNDRL